MNEFKIEASFRKGKVCGFLEELIELCLKHKVSIGSNRDKNTDFNSKTEIAFHEWDSFTDLVVDKEGASLYWPRIQTDIVVRRKK